MLRSDLMHLPRDPAAMGTAFFAFGLFFTAKGSLAFARRLQSNGDGE